MRTQNFIGVVVLAMAIAGCGDKGGDGSAGIESVPDASALQLELLGGAAEGASLQADLVAATPSTPVFDDLAAGREKVAAVNAAIRTVLEAVAQVAADGGAPAPGSGRVYGPADRCVVDTTPCPAGATATFRLEVWNAVGKGGAFVLEAKAPGASDAAYQPALAGWMRRGALARRGAGQVWINLENLRAAATAYPGSGHLVGGFAAGPVAKVLKYRLLDFTPDPARWPAATVAYRGYKTAAGTTRVRVAGISDLYQVTDDTELGLGHLVYNPALGGRAYSLVTNYSWDGATHGDVPAGKYFLGRSCYAAGSTTPAYKEWFLCPTTKGPVACIDTETATPDPETTGTSWAAGCAVALAAEFEAPTSAPPTDPTASPAADPGESAAGLTAEDAPLDQTGAPVPPT